MARKVTTVISLRDNYTAVVKKARRYTSAFQKDVAKMTARLDKASKKKHDIRVKNSAAMKALSAVEKKIAPIRNVMVKVAANVAHFRNQIRPVTDAVKKIAGKAWTVTVKLKDGVTAALGKITSALKKAGKVVAVGAAATVAAGGYAISKGMELESYDVSMAHFVGVNNPKSSAEAVQAQTEQYLAWLRANANATPFGTGEVIQAGARAVQIAEGNTSAAQGLVRMAEDMAALTPGKTVMDAMEALADAQMGEMERMKEFGFKMTAEAFKKSKGNLFATKSVSGKTLEQVFGGGAAKFALTTSGMISTITGELESEIADIGLGMAKEMKPFLQWVLTDVIPELKVLMFDVGAGGKTGIQVITDALKSAYYWLRDEIPNAIKFLQETWASFTAAINDPNGVIRKILGVFGVSLPTISTGAAADTGTKSGDAGAKTGGANPNGKPIFPLKLPEVAGRPLTAEDALTGYFALKGGSILSRMFTGKGLAANAGKLVKESAKLGAAAASDAAIAVAAASPAANAAMVSGTSWLGNIMAAGGSTFFPAAYYWWQDQKSLASFDYWEKTGGKDFDKAPWGDKAAVWLNRGLPGLNGWTPPGLVDGLNNLQNGTYTDMAAKGFKLMIEQPEVASGNLKKALGMLFGGTPKTQPDLGAALTVPKVDTNTWASQWAGIPGVAQLQGVKDVTEALKTSPASQWAGIPGVMQAIGSEALTAAGNVQALKDALGDVSSTHISDSGTVHGGGAGRGFAAGIKRVPYDNFPALLHKGEAVLPSGEAGAYRSLGNHAGGGNTINLKIEVNGGNMDENKLASLLVNRLREAALNMA